MASLKNAAENTTITLKPYHTFGRGVKGHLCTPLEDPVVSRLHAAINWTGSEWQFMDLNSLNGSWINGERLNPDIKTPLKLHDKIQLGGIDATTWTVESLAPPAAVLIPQQGDGIAIDVYDLLALPNERDPQIYVRCDNFGQWLCEYDSGPERIEHNSIIRLGELAWLFQNPIPPPDTLIHQSELPLKALLFSFNVSQDEEHIALKVCKNSTWTDLGERTHHYLLLMLCRALLEEIEKGQDPSNSGWCYISDLCQSLGYAETHLNIHIFRIRKQCSESLTHIADLATLIERRAGQIRVCLPPTAIVINKEGKPL